MLVPKINITKINFFSVIKKKHLLKLDLEIDSLSSLFASLKTNRMATSDQVQALIEAHTGPLLTRIEELTKVLGRLTTSETVGEFEEELINITVRCDEPLDVIKSMPTFDGKNSYVSWREAATHSMNLYTRGSKRYYSALTILRNKIIDEANDTLTNHGTVLNFDAIISRLDFAYADKRPLHLIEQELSVMRQGPQSIMTYYNEVNKKLTDLINKTIMTHGTNSELTRELNNRNRQYALRVFITGLNHPLNDILFSVSPNSLPDALSKAQELEANKVRANFALHFNKPNAHNNFKTQNLLRFPNRTRRDPHFNHFNNRHVEQKPEPMELGSSANVVTRPPVGFNRNNEGYSRPFYHNNNFQPRQTNNNNQYGIKRPLTGSGQFSHQPQNKAQRINNLNEESFLGQELDCPTSLGQPQQDRDSEF